MQPLLADVDTIAQAPTETLKGTPWEKVGTKLPENASIGETLTMAGLDWAVNKCPIAFDGSNNENPTYVKMDESYALIKATDLTVLSPYVGSNYKPIQNEDAFKVFRDFVLAGNMQMETAGSLKRGQHIWGLAALSDRFEIADGEFLQGYFLLLQSHKYGHSLRAMFTPIRYPSGHTFTKGLGKTLTYHMAHNRVFDENRIKEITGLIKNARSGLNKFGETARFLVNTPLPQAQAVKFLAGMFAKKPKDGEELPPLPDTIEELAASSDYGRTIQTVAQIAPTYFQGETASCQGTAWGFYNLAAHYLDKVSGRTVDARLESAWLGTNAKKKYEAFTSIQAHAVHVPSKK